MLKWAREGIIWKRFLIFIILALLYFTHLITFGFGRAYERKAQEEKGVTRAQCMKYIIDKDDQDYERFLKRLFKKDPFQVKP